MMLFILAVVILCSALIIFAGICQVCSAIRRLEDSLQTEIAVQCNNIAKAVDDVEVALENIENQMRG